MEHPITPPLELVRKWCAHSNEHETYDQFWCHIATQAAQWGADQELEACCKWLPKYCPWDADQLRAARRPKPPSLKEQALEALNQMDEPLGVVTARRASIIRRALEALPND